MTTEVTNEIFYRDAINQALAEEMRRDSSVVLYGEDIGRGMGTKAVGDCLDECRALAAGKAQSLPRACPVVGQRLALPREHRHPCLGNGCCCVVLG